MHPITLAVTASLLPRPLEAFLTAPPAAVTEAPSSSLATDPSRPNEKASVLRASMPFDLPAFPAPTALAAAASISAPSSSELIRQSTYPLIEFSSRVQRVGEQAFAASFVIALVQAAVALYQYRTNPQGELIVPPGPTWGVERAAAGGTAIDGGDEWLDEGVVSPKVGELDPPTARPPPAPLSAAPVASSSAPSDLPFLSGEDYPVVTANNGEGGGATSFYSRIVNRLNRWLFLLLPWMAGRWSFLLEKHSHLLHVGFIFTLASVFDVRPFRRWAPSIPFFVSTDDKVNAIETTEMCPPAQRHTKGPPGRVVVVGDSLAVGIGCVDIYDPLKNNTLPIERIERLAPPRFSKKFSGPPGSPTVRDGPVFPRSFARTLSRRTGRAVRWRSGGVDGGDVDDIRTHCFGIIEEEVAAGRPPDVVVIICGINDLKKFVGNPFKSRGAASFRSSLTNLIRDIERTVPGAKVVLPGLPTQMFHKNSIVNIFPLALFLDAIVGYWDSQKKLVADVHPNPNVLYLGLNPKEIYDWYRDGRKGDSRVGRDASLIAVDGVHPNRRCYSRWAENMGEQLCDAMGWGIDREVERPGAPVPAIADV